MRQAGIWRKLAAVFTRREQGRGTLILYVCPHSVFEKNNSHPLARIRKLLYTTRDASVAQWIEQWPPEPRASVRFLSDAFSDVLKYRGSETGKRLPDLGNVPD